MKLAPIVLFVYNRPFHTGRTLEALSKNHFSKDSTLIIFADGPLKEANTNDLAKINEVRKIIKAKKWCGEVIIHERKENYGLAKSILNGVTKVINTYGKAIVLEDDIITSIGFLKYMNTALNIYEQEEMVMHISAYMFPVKSKLPDTFFYNTASCWGWATWKRAWKLLEVDPNNLYNQIMKEKRVDEFNIDNTYPFSDQLINNINGKMYTWAVLWYGSIFLRRGLCLHPHHSLTNNIGFDKSGTNCFTETKYQWDNLTTNIEVKRIELKPSKAAWNAMKRFHFEGESTKINLINKIKVKIKRMGRSMIIKSILH